MKIIAQKQLIANVMKKAVKIANPKATMPILSHVAISFDGEMCTITANDSARTYSERFPATGDPGQCAVEADKLSRAVNGMANGDVEITPEYVKQGRSKLKLNSRSYGDFPQPDYDDATDCGITGDQLADLISIVSHAVPVKDVRPMLNGIHLAPGHCVATDGHRMAWVDCEYSGSAIIVPAESIRQMNDLQGRVSVSDRQIVVESDTARFSSNLIDSKYPDWQRMIPEKFDATATINTDAMIAAMKTVQVGGDTARMEFSGGQCHVSNKNAESAFDCECDADIVVGSFIQYMIDAALASGSDTLTIGLNPSRPGMLINDRFVVMPVRL